MKEHEKEIVDFVKAQSPKIESVQIDWNSMVIEESGNGTPQGGGYNLSISGKINQLKNTKFSVDFIVHPSILNKAIIDVTVSKIILVCFFIIYP